MLSVVLLAGSGGTPSIGNGDPPTPAFYVATDGNDSNPGTLAAPFASFAACQTAMQASTTVKTCYIRAGTYDLTTASHSCAVYLLQADSGETWSGYPPDGTDTAILDGGANSVGCAFEIDDIGGPASGITITNLQMQTLSGTAAVYVINGSNVTVSNNVIHDLPHANAGVQFECVYAQSNWGGFVITHNYIYNIAQMGVRMDDSNTAATPPCAFGYQTTIDHNYFYNVCESGADCGAIYMEEDQPPSNLPLLVEYNYARDIDPDHIPAYGPSGSPYWYDSLIYQDGGNANMIATGNVMVSGYVNQCWAPGGSENSIFTGNICDFVTNQNGPGTGFDEYSMGVPTGLMTGNQAVGNVMIMDTAPGNTGGGWRAVGTTPYAPMYVTNNAYFNYGAAGSVNYGCNGTNACGANGTSTTQDNNASYANPQISCWAPIIAAGSPVFGAPVNFPALPADWATPGFWGPPGFTIPQIGTPPSWPHAC